MLSLSILLIGLSFLLADIRENVVLYLPPADDSVTEESLDSSIEVSKLTGRVTSTPWCAIYSKAVLQLHMPKEPTSESATPTNVLLAFHDIPLLLLLYYHGYYLPGIK